MSLSCDKEDTNCSCLDSEGKYIFPIKPGTEEWKKLNSHQEMVDICQIPDKTLKHMSTSGLIDTYFDYPLLFTILAFNNTNEGLRQIANEFNGFSELLRRNDCATILLQKYQRIDPASINGMSDSLEIGFFMLKIEFFELTLGFEPLRNKLTREECKKIIEIGLKNLEKKETNNYGGFSLRVSIYLLSKILELEQYDVFLEYLKQNSYFNYFLKGYLACFDFEKDYLSIKNICKKYKKN